MKPKLRLPAVLPLILAMLAPTIATRAATNYTIANASGWNLIANQLDGPNGNTIANVIPSAPVGSQVKKFNLTTKTFQTVETLTAAAGWSPGTNILNPGDGLYFFNSSAGNFNLTFSGNPHVPVLPLNIGPGMVLVARQTND